MKAVNKFNKDAMDSLFINVNLKHWSTDSYPQSGNNAQKLLNSQIVDSADAAIAIFWTRFGTPTDKYDSGTEEEIDRMMNSKRQVFLYFLDKPVPPSMTDSLDYIENRKKIVTLTQKYLGLYWTVKDEMELQNQLPDHLNKYYSSINNNNFQITNSWVHSGTKNEVSPDELIKNGNTVTQLDGNKIRAEVNISDDNPIYAEFDIERNQASNICVDGFSLDIPRSIIINKQEGITTIQGIEYRDEIFILKFGGYLNAAYDEVSGKMKYFSGKAPAGMTIFVDKTNKLIHIVDKSVVTLNVPKGK